MPAPFRILALLLALALATPALACLVPADTAALQAQLLKSLNTERKARGLSALRLSVKLEKAAQSHACDNANRRSVSHTSSDGGSLKTRLRKVGYAFRTAAENTGRGFGSGTKAVDWWMSSPEHRSNLLIGKAHEVGVGIAVSAAPDSKLHWTLVIGAGR
jgi:uncharacterized protein YkwD